MTMLPQKPITKPGEGKQREKYVSQERYLEERYQISVGLKGPKRLGVESSKRQKGEKYKDFVGRGCPTQSGHSELATVAKANPKRG